MAITISSQPKSSMSDASIDNLGVPDSCRMMYKGFDLVNTQTSKLMLHCCKQLSNAACKQGLTPDDKSDLMRSCLWDQVACCSCSIVEILCFCASCSSLSEHGCLSLTSLLVRLGPAYSGYPDSSIWIPAICTASVAADGLSRCPWQQWLARSCHA